MQYRKLLHQLRQPYDRDGYAQLELDVHAMHEAMYQRIVRLSDINNRMAELWHRWQWRFEEDNDEEI